MNTDPQKSPSPRLPQTYQAFYLGGVGPYVAWRGLTFSLDYKNGNRDAFPYAYVMRFGYDASGSILIEMPEITVTLRGRNLAALFEALLDHTVRSITEADVIYETVAAGETLVSHIEVRANGRPPDGHQ